LTRYIEDSISTALGCYTNDQLSSLDHLAGLGGRRNHHASRIRLQLRIAYLILRDLQLRLNGIELSASRIPRLFCAFVLNARRDVPGQKEFLTLVVILCFS
jgi:hypothetical protein